MLNVFLLGVTIGLSHGAMEGKPTEQEALRKFTKASYKEMGLDEQVKQLEKRYLSKEVIFYGGWTAQISRVVIEKRIVYEWTF